MQLTRKKSGFACPALLAIHLKRAIIKNGWKLKSRRDLKVSEALPGPRKVPKHLHVTAKLSTTTFLLYTALRPPHKRGERGLIAVAAGAAGLGVRPDAANDSIYPQQLISSSGTNRDDRFVALCCLAGYAGFLALGM